MAADSDDRLLPARRTPPAGLARREPSGPPGDLQVLFFASQELDIDTELRQLILSADLVCALGGVDLDRLASFMAPTTPALCVLSGDDPERRPPTPFRLLHGNGVNFRGWRIAGLSGSPAISGGRSVEAGLKLTEREAGVLLDAMPACDILLTHAAPSFAANEPDAFTSLRHYIERTEPRYCFYAAPFDHEVREHGPTMLAGVCGVLNLPPLPMF